MFVSLEDAFQIVLDLARQNVLTEDIADGDEALELQRARQEESIRVIEDYILNQKS